MAPNPTFTRSHADEIIIEETNKMPLMLVAFGAANREITDTANPINGGTARIADGMANVGSKRRRRRFNFATEAGIAERV